MSLDLLDLPVWTIRPNWAGGVVERLEWLSSVLASLSSGSEQRQALRLSPRRSFEITVNPMKAERSYTDLFLHRMAAEEMLFPLWHDQAKLSSGMTAGNTALVFDNTYREHAAGQCALLYKDAFTWELIYVEAVSSGGITATDPVVNDWPKGTTVYPLRAARLTADSSFSALTGTVGEAQLLFTMSRDNDFVEEDTFDLVYAGLPVLTVPPNRSEALDQSFQRLLAELDNSTGLRRVLDLPGRSFVTQVHGWMCRGRQEQYELRKLLYYLRGRTRAVWFPTFNDDIEIARNAVIGDSVIDIDKIGYAYTGGVVDGRRQLLLRSGSTYEVAAITALGSALATDEERLVLNDPIGTSLPVGATASFMDTMRLDQDTVEITHHTDSDGVCEIAGAFRSFRNARDESDPGSHAIPSASMGGGSCGGTGSGLAGPPWTNLGTDFFNIGAGQETSGTQTAFQSWFPGYIDSLRVTKGVARYPVSSYTAPIADFPSDGSDPFWADVVTLLKFNGTNGATTSLCEKGNTVTHNGGASLNTSIKKFGSSSCHFDGVNDWVKVVVGSTGQALGDTFTIEAWVHPTGRVNMGTPADYWHYGAPILSAGPLSTSGRDHYFSIFTDTVLFHEQGPWPSLSPYFRFETTAPSVPLNDWTFVSVCRDGSTGTYYIHVNGELAEPV